MKTRSANFYMNLLIFLSWLAYVSAYIGRYNFSASMIAVIGDLNATKAEVGLVTSFFFFAYGIGQLVNGLLCYKYNSKLMIFIALAASSIINLLMTFTNSVSIMKYLWGCNGIVQSVLWSSIVRLQSEYLTPKKTTTAIIVMSTTTAVGTFAAYGMASLFVALGAWRVVLYIGTGALLVTAVLWLLGLTKVQSKLEKHVDLVAEKTPAQEKQKIFTPIFITAFCFVLISAAINGLIKDGVVTWVPNLIYETFAIADYFSILLTLLLPVSAIFGTALVQLIYRKIRNYVVIMAMLFTASAVMLVIICIFYMNSIALTLVLFSLISCSMSGINNILTSALPLSGGKRWRAGTVAGIVGTFSYVGSTVAIVLLGALSESGGWSIVLKFLAIMCAIAIVISSVGGILWSKAAKSRVEPPSTELVD